MATSIAAGSTVSIALPSGTAITLSGYGNAQFTPPSGGGVGSRTFHVILPTPTTLGPYGSSLTLIVSAAAGGPGLTYTTKAPLETGASTSAITNLAALQPIAAALRGAVAGEVIITATGDSITQFGGDTIPQTSDVLAEQAGYRASVRRELNARMGLSSYDGGQWIAADAVVADTRVANGGAAVAVPAFNPYVGWRNSSSAIINRKAMSLQASGDTITFTFTGRYLNVMQWENAASSYNGTFSYTIDGGGATNITSSGAQDTYRLNRIDCGTIAAHTVVLTWVSAKILIAGALTSNGLGIVTARFGVGSTTALDWAGRAEKEQRTSFKTLASPLHIIRFSYNDWNRQVSQSITPAVFLTNLQTLIGLAQANPANKAVLLMADPPNSTPDTLPTSYETYRQVLQSLATGNVAYFDVKTAVNSSWSKGNANGQYVDFVHRSGAGYAAEASALASVLFDPSLLAN